MQQDSNKALSKRQRNRRLKRIVIAHLLIVASFFAATFFWGNFE